MEDQNKPIQGEEANSVIRNHMVWAMGAGFIPVPVADFFAVSAIQLDMVRQLCRVYEIEFKETEGKAIITSITSSGLARLAARTIVKFIPGAGSFIGGMAVSVLSGASTYALGHAFKKHFDTGGTFLDFDLSRLKNVYDELFEKGKQEAEQIKTDDAASAFTVPKDTKTTSSGDIISKIAELAALKEKGLITDAEFQKMKEKLLNDI